MCIMISLKFQSQQLRSYGCQVSTLFKRTALRLHEFDIYIACNRIFYIHLIVFCRLSYPVVWVLTLCARCFPAVICHMLGEKKTNWFTGTRCCEYQPKLEKVKLFTSVVTVQFCKDILFSCCFGTGVSCNLSQYLCINHPVGIQRLHIAYHTRTHIDTHVHTYTHMHVHYIVWSMSVRLLLQAGLVVSKISALTLNATLPLKRDAKIKK